LARARQDPAIPGIQATLGGCLAGGGVDGEICGSHPSQTLRTVFMTMRLRMP